MKPIDLSNSISFHDSTLEKVDVANDNITLFLDSVAGPSSFLKDPSGDGYAILTGVTIKCVAADTVLLEYWIDSSCPIEHPRPEHPISEIMENDLVGDVLKISGWGIDPGWVEWKIKADCFTLSWSDERLGSFPNKL